MEQNRVPKLLNLLQRSGSSPLHLVVSTKKFGGNWSRSSFSRQTYNHPFSVYNGRSHSSRGTSLQLQQQLPHPQPALPLDYPPFLPQKEFDVIVGRCATLDAFIGSNKHYYVTPKTLDTPMPYLRTLRLIEEKRSYAYGGATSLGPSQVIDEDEYPRLFFGKVTPRLRELCFEFIHARWEDPIYSNLLNLRLFNPKKRASLSQILRILEACPKMTHLELTECLQPGTFLPTDEINEGLNIDSPTLSLSRLKHLRVEDSDGTSLTNLLSSFSLPPLDYLFLNTLDSSCFTDKFGRPLKSLLPTIGKPTDLLVNGQYNQWSLCAQQRESPMGNKPDRRWNYTYRILNGVSPYQHQAYIQPPFVTNPIGINPAAIGNTSVTNTSLTTQSDAGGWSATAIAIGVSISQVPAGLRTHPAVARAFNPIECINCLQQASLGGVQFDGIERLEIGSGTHFSDDFYHDLLSRCENIQKLRFSYNHGIGILLAIIKQELCPKLTEIYLYNPGSYPGMVTLPSTASLADWVESRRYVEGLQPLKKIVVDVFDGVDPILTEEVRKRIQDGLGSGGEFIWRVTPNLSTGRTLKWEEMIEEDLNAIEPPEASTATGQSGGEQKTANVAVASIKSPREGLGILPVISEKRVEDPLDEWPLSKPTLHPAWSAGPW